MLTHNLGKIQYYFIVYLSILLSHLKSLNSLRVCMYMDVFLCTYSTFTVGVYIIYFICITIYICVCICLYI